MRSQQARRLESWEASKLESWEAGKQRIMNIEFRIINLEPETANGQRLTEFIPLPNS